ncbi:6-phospho-beta-glucosidase [Arthrobacter sp. JZ12]|uniref:family 4 glycosyl hydrolase n=1 Tax=Arthrobacter sp. JZ12 TaxID=2654190 RepID=UPI002B483BE8|nr:6-phospho-beta-glucosidase [Arthrobacter sp. JZ12]WRH25550.1 6-phospho-beta-glucosidase [Arthrobacter sp. JZ12]
MKLTVVGGGGFRVPLVYRALAAGAFAGLIDSVCLYDVDSSRAAAIARVVEGMPLPVGARRPALEVSVSLQDALAGAAVVFVAIRPGGAAGRVLDERVALAEGVLGQETVGAGGLSYALRSVPEMLQVAQAISRICPDAWVINFTNPAGIITEALQPLLGNRVIGICDSASGLVRRAAEAAGVPLPLGSLTGVDYVGLNHLGWLRRLEHDGADLLPALLADPGRLGSFEEGRVFGAQFLPVLGAVPNEYLFYYYFHAEALRSVAAAPQTRGESLVRQQEGLYPELLSAPNPFDVWEEARRARESGYLAEARSPEESRDEADLAGGGYELIALTVMRALLLDEPAELIVNVRNSGAVTGLPSDAVVEVPCRVDGQGAIPLPVSAPDPHQLGLMSQVKGVEQDVIAAVVHGDRSLALRAFALHPLINSAHTATRLLAGYERAFPALSELWR